MAETGFAPVGENEPTLINEDVAVVKVVVMQGGRRAPACQSSAKFLDPRQQMVKPSGFIVGNGFRVTTGQRPRVADQPRVGPRQGLGPPIQRPQPEQLGGTLHPFDLELCHPHQGRGELTEVFFASH